MCLDKNAVEWGNAWREHYRTWLSGAGIVLRADQRGYGPALNRWVDGNLFPRFTYAKTALRKTSLDR